MMYSSLKEDLVKAQKSGDTKLVGILKLILSELSYAQVDYKEGELPDSEVIKVLMKEAKKRKDAVGIYEKAGSTERAESERYELSVIESYLPQMMSEGEVKEEVLKVISETGFSGGRLIGAVMGRLKGKADGSLVQKVVAELG